MAISADGGLFVGTSWFLAKSKSRGERLLIASLAKWDVETFYPLVRQRKAGDKGLEPLFPTYVFCNFDATAPSWQAIRWAPGLAYFLRISDELARIDDSLVEFLREKTRRWNEGVTTTRFQAGDRVEVVSGPFAGFSAIFVKQMQARERCQVLLQAVRGVSSVEIDESHVGPAQRGWRRRFGAARA